MSHFFLGSEKVYLHRNPISQSAKKQLRTLIVEWTSVKNTI